MDESSIRSRMQEVFSLVVSDIGTIRTGQATTAIFQDIEILAYGGQQKLRLQELATIAKADNQNITIDPWDKSIIGEIKQGILAANIGLNPSIDGEIIRVNVPPLTSEDREKYTKLLSTKLESGKVMIRQVRGDAIKEIRKEFEKKQISEDEKFNQEKKLQGITDEYTEKIDKAGEKKKQELLQM